MPTSTTTAAIYVSISYNHWLVTHLAKMIERTHWGDVSVNVWYNWSITTIPATYTPTQHQIKQIHHQDILTFFSSGHPYACVISNVALLFVPFISILFTLCAFFKNEMQMWLIINSSSLIVRLVNVISSTPQHWNEFFNVDGGWGRNAKDMYCVDFVVTGILTSLKRKLMMLHTQMSS